MTTEEQNAFNLIAQEMSDCGDPDCSVIGGMMSSMSFNVVADDWSCDYYPQGCGGETDGNYNAWVSRGGTDGVTDVAYEASTAFHETIHQYLGSSNESAALGIEGWCEGLISWG